MEIVALFVAAFLQLAVLVVEQLRETVDAIEAALANRYVEATEGTCRARLGDEPDRDVPASDALEAALRLAAERVR